MRVSVLRTTVPFRRTDALSVVVKVVYVFDFFLFRLVETLVGFVLCCSMLVVGCLLLLGA